MHIYVNLSYTLYVIGMIMFAASSHKCLVAGCNVKWLCNSSISIFGAVAACSWALVLQADFSHGKAFSKYLFLFCDLKCISHNWTRIFFLMISNSSLIGNTASIERSLLNMSIHLTWYWVEVRGIEVWYILFQPVWNPKSKGKLCWHVSVTFLCIYLFVRCRYLYIYGLMNLIEHHNA